MIHEAIYSLYANARTIDGDTFETITVFDGSGSDITSSLDKSAIDAEVVSLTAAAEADTLKEASDLASAKSKLEGLGLSIDEIKVAFGI